MSGQEIRGMNETERLLLEGVKRSGSDLHITHNEAWSRPWRISFLVGVGPDVVIYGESLVQAAGAMVERLRRLDRKS